MYDPKKNKTVKEFMLKSGLVIGIYRYGGGDPKLGFSREYETKNELKRGKAGRLNWEEVLEMQKLFPKIIEVMGDA